MSTPQIVTKKPGFLEFWSLLNDRAKITITTLSGLSFALSLFIQVAIARRGGTRFANLFFDADTALLLYDRHVATFRHLVLPFLIHVPATLLSTSLNFLLGQPLREIYDWTAFVICALAAAASTAALLLILLRIGIGLPLAVLIASIDLSSLSRLTTGSVVESFAYTGCFLRVSLLMVSFPPSLSTWESRLLPFGVAVLTIGTTLTNVVFWGLCMMKVSYLDHRNSIFRSILRTSLWAGLAIVVALVSLFLSAPIRKLHWKNIVGSLIYNVGESARHKRAPDFSRALQLSTAVGDAFLAPRPNLQTVKTIDASSSSFASNVGRLQDPESTFGQTQAVTYRWDALHPRGQLWQLLLVWVLLGSGSLGLWMAGGLARQVFVITASWVLFNLCLLSVWGDDDVFVYSMHWQSVATFWFAGCLTSNSALKNISIALLLTLLASQLWWNSENVRYSLEVLDFGVKQVKY